MSHHSIWSGLRLNKIICMEEVNQTGNNNVVPPQVGLHLKTLFKQWLIQKHPQSFEMTVFFHETSNLHLHKFLCM